MINEKVMCFIYGLDETAAYSYKGRPQFPSQVGRLQSETRLDMGAGRQPRVSITVAHVSSTLRLKNITGSESAADVLEEYFELIGGREKIFEETNKAARGKKRGRPGVPSAAATTKKSRKNGSHPASSTPPATAKWTPPLGSWEDDIEYIDACEDEGSGKLVVYLNWKNGKKTKHDTSVIYKKCPQKVRNAAFCSLKQTY
jgi:hypothetical protein